MGIFNSYVRLPEGNNVVKDEPPHFQTGMNQNPCTVFRGTEDLWKNQLFWYDQMTQFSSAKTNPPAHFPKSTKSLVLIYPLVMTNIAMV